MTPRSSRALACAALLIAAAPSSASRPADGRERAAPRLSIARLQYEGDDWYANPSSLPNLIRAVRERTSLEVDPREVRTTLLDDRLWASRTIRHAPASSGRRMACPSRSVAIATICPLA